MKERPIIFNTEMVQAILDGRKTQTRRVITLTDFQEAETNGYDFMFRDKNFCWNKVKADRFLDKFTKWHIGDLLWVRETWLVEAHPLAGARVRYKAGGETKDVTGLGKEVADSYKHRDGWRPSIHMYKWAARIWLKVLDVRVERLQEISIKDIFAEGVDDMVLLPMESTPDLPEFHNCAQGQMRTGFEILWDSINAKRGYSWEINPYVWVIEFERITNKQDKTEERNG
jgi:hypothetical protein